MNHCSKVITVDGLGKAYLIGASRRRDDTLRDSIANAFKTTWNSLHSRRRNLHGSEEFWALRDVSFEVGEGEVLGIIGRNGAGKSTLLKILSRITQPTEGRAEIDGRVGSLLEVGTGFHPELTGAENIYLSGALLGMRRREIKAKFDEIAQFSGIEHFLSTPVKKYSSGMYVRLAFAVAAHLEPEILLIDEVLAVGDAEFRSKCLKKMEDVSGSGRTILFVSHNMAAIQNLCTSCILLDRGRVSAHGSTDDIVSLYMAETLSLMQSADIAGRTDRVGSGRLRFTGIRILGKTGEPVSAGQTGAELTVEIEYESTQSGSSAVLCLLFTNADGQRLFACLSRSSSESTIYVSDKGRFLCTIPKLPLLPGVFALSCWCKLNEEMADEVKDAFSLQVEAGDFHGTGKLTPSAGGDIAVSNYWKSL